MAGETVAPAGGDQRALHVLIVEDSEDDALLLVRQLRRGGFDAVHHRVESLGALEVALAAGQWDLVITDYNMPQFSPDDVVAALRARNLDVPIILVSAHLADARAAAAMKAGIHDYVLKDNLARLAPAVERELREARNRRAHRRTSAELEHLAQHDPLTGLANRGQIEKRLAAVLDGIDERGHAFLNLDIDQFHVVNDTGGHPAGDELIRRIAGVVNACVHESDTLARIGPDEFGLLLERCPLSPAWRIAERIQQAVAAERIEIGGRVFQTTISIGLVPIMHSGDSVAEIIRRGDLTCRAAKDLGANRIRVYSPDDVDLARRHGDMEWVARLRAGLEENRFVLHQQPMRALANARGQPFAELLLRLVEGDGCLVEPGRFIPAAERFDLMPLIDRQVVRDAFRGIAARSSDPGVERWFINLSGRSLSDDGLPAYVRHELASFGIDPGRICFEVTETAAIRHINVALRFMHEVRALGCAVALDDFGSGLSSFNYLKSLPADYIKIDGSFVQRMLDHPLDYTIVDAITRIGHGAGMEVIAEMAESKETVEALGELGVDYVQGCIVARPAPCRGGWQERRGAPGAGPSARE